MFLKENKREKLIAKQKSIAVIPKQNSGINDYVIQVPLQRTE